MCDAQQEHQDAAKQSLQRSILALAVGLAVAADAARVEVAVDLELALGGLRHTSLFRFVPFRGHRAVPVDISSFSNGQQCKILARGGSPSSHPFPLFASAAV
jgi:hypothetical protein